MGWFVEKLSSLFHHFTRQPQKADIDTEYEQQDSQTRLLSQRTSEDELLSESRRGTLRRIGGGIPAHVPSYPSASASATSLSMVQPIPETQMHVGPHSSTTASHVLVEKHSWSTPLNQIIRPNRKLIWTPSREHLQLVPIDERRTPTMAMDVVDEKNEDSEPSPRTTAKATYNESSAPKGDSRIGRITHQSRTKR